jgi:beta-glucanase (GH16 family)
MTKRKMPQKSFNNQHFFCRFLVVFFFCSSHPDAPATTSGETHSLDYTSGAIDTRGKFEFKYGYIEGRFKAPWQSRT